MHVVATAAVSLALSAQPGQPVEVAQVGLGSLLGAPIPGLDGGAWVQVDRSIFALSRRRFASETRSDA